MAELQITTSIVEKLSVAEMCVTYNVAIFRWFRLHSRVLPAQQELEKDVGENGGAGVPILYDCVVCLCEVEPEENGSRKLPNCDHGVQFHEGCIESWLKDHPTCPLCRTHVSRPVRLRLKACLFKVRDDMVSYCYNALENVATSIGDCDHDS